MNRETFLVFLVVATAWAVGISIKALRCLTANKPYVFGMWDGGMLRKGKELGRGRTQVKLVIAVLIAGFACALLAGVRMPHEATYVLWGLVIASLVSDLTAPEKGFDDRQ
ncbi:MAG TPA: hypothetical protein VGM90_26385 [Kofleriaceae bacterium]|jgi:hypothetical protein